VKGKEEESSAGEGVLVEDGHQYRDEERLIRKACLFPFFDTIERFADDLFIQ